jgi:chaperone modulatory protein CbpM
MIVSRQDFLARSGLETGTLEVWIEQRWLIPRPTAQGPAFSEADVARARLIGDLTRDLGVNDEGVDVILHLMDQLHGLRRALADLRAAPTEP